MNVDAKLDCKNVLVIDDDQAIRETMKDVLEIHGYNVITAKDGHDGIKKLSTMAVAPCLILLDLMMPGMNGWGFLDYQRTHPAFSSIPVVICSAYEASARSIGTSPVIIKPIKLDSLLGAVNAFCA
jgi:CheY-like chemotaxis protein